MSILAGETVSSSSYTSVSYIGIAVVLTLLTTSITTVPAVVFGASSYLALKSIEVICPDPVTKFHQDVHQDDLRALIKIIVCAVVVIFVAAGVGVGALTLIGVPITLGVASGITGVSAILSAMVSILFEK